MTYRRWMDAKTAPKVIPELYVRSVMQGIYQLVSEGFLSFESPRVKKLMSTHFQDGYQLAVLAELGLPKDFAKNLKDGHDDRIASSLAKIGSTSKKQKSVEKNSTLLKKCQTFGVEWKQRISQLTTVISAKGIPPIDKFVAYGALFYLITPFDLIPDSIPVFGFLDDFGVLGIAALHYSRKFPALLGK